jgi:hypothetical protein
LGCRKLSHSIVVIKPESLSKQKFFKKAGDFSARRRHSTGTIALLLTDATTPTAVNIEDEEVQAAKTQLAAE